MKDTTRDAAGVTIRIGDTVGGTTRRNITIVGELIEVGHALVKVRLESDGVPATEGAPAPLAGAEVTIKADRLFLVRRAVKTRQTLFTGGVEDALTPDARQEAAWLLMRAVNGCDCTDPYPVLCTAGCQLAPEGPQCRCHHIRTASEVRSLITRVRAMNPIVDDLDGLQRHMAEVYNESGCQDQDAQRWAREFLAHHARALAAVMHMVCPYLTGDAGQPFADGFGGGADYLRAYAYGLDPEGNGGK